MEEARENELVLQAQGGSTKAFTELEKQYHWLVFKVAKDILSEAGIAAAHVEAEDVLQDTFEYAFVHIKEYRMPSRFYRWLWSLAKVRAMRTRRALLHRAKNECEYDDDYREGWDSEPSPDVVDCIERGFDPYTPARLRRLLRNLPPQQRADLQMLAEGLRPRQIAKKTGRDIEAVKKNLTRAKQGAKRVLENVHVLTD